VGVWTVQPCSKPVLCGTALLDRRGIRLYAENSVRKRKLTGKRKTKATAVSAKQGHTGFQNKNRRYSAPMKIMINGGDDNTIRFLCLLGVHWENFTV
jgi:hypothetical protein